jgi:hypothetical protein
MSRITAQAPISPLLPHPRLHLSFSFNFSHSLLFHFTPPQGSIFRFENDIYSPSPSWKWYFFPLSRFVVYRLPLWLFCLNSSLFCIYFTLLLPLFSFSFPFFLFIFPFFLFLLHFPHFSLHLFIFFPPNDIGWYFPPQGGGGGYLPIYRPLPPQPPT